MSKTEFKMTAYTGAVIQAPFLGKIVFDIAGMNLAPPLPALREHARDRAAGIVERVEKSAQALSARGRFVDTADGRELKNLLSEGFPLQASIGVYFDALEEIPKGETARVNLTSFEGPGFVARQSTIREISFVSLGADPGTRVTALAAAAPPGGDVQAFFAELTHKFSAPNDADAEISRLAADLARREGLSLAQATERIFTERPDLAAAWLRAVNASVC